MVELKKGSNEKVDNYYKRLLTEKFELKNSYQGISISDIEFVLRRLDCYTDEIRDAIWCLLNDEFPSLFSKAVGLTIADGGSTAHIGGYVGILMRKRERLDREGRDYWIKPLISIGAIERCTYMPQEEAFVSGHIKAKSSNSAYRLDSSFVNLLLNTKNENFEDLLREWISKSSIEKRLKIQAEATKEVETGKSNPHVQLIKDSISIYAKHFLNTYEPVFTDESDGDRISEDEKTILKKYDILIELDDVWPDVILIDKRKNSLWFIEAVNSDGEVDEQKIVGLKKICKKSKKSFGGATTTYATWKELAERQRKYKNLAEDSYIWIREDPGKHFRILSQ